MAKKKLSEQIIVITGATSGIGLATAREAVSRGARVVLAARNEEDLALIAEGLDQHVREHYVNLGTTYWIEPNLSVGARGAFFVREVSGDEMATGHRSLFVTARLVL